MIPSTSRFFVACLTALCAFTAAMTAAVTATQAPAPTPAQTSSANPTETADGIPIASPVVRQACAPCHTTDEKGRLSRISFQRSTPEGWQGTIKRMVALNGLKIEPQTARDVVKELSNRLGLAPEEARPAAYEAERRLGDFKYAANADVESVCSRCHTVGRVISQRRTREEWDLVIAMHRGWYPLVDRQGFRRLGPVPRDRAADGRPADTRHPVEKALDHLKTAYPLHTPDWTAWSATVRPARLEGTWALSGWEPGKGALFGRVTLKPVASTTDEFESQITYTYARSGRVVSRTGRVTLYTGFQWRGRSTEGSDAQSALREVMFVERDWRRIEGRWFAGGYDETGLDVRLDRLGRESTVLGVDRLALVSGTSAQTVKVYGANLPTSLGPPDVDLGPGITVSRVVDASADSFTLSVDVSPDAVVGPRDLFVAGAARPSALVVYDRVDTVKVTPAWNMARIGGAGSFPKMLAQFEAWGYHHGRDGKPDTADDIKLDVLPVTWSLEEYTATYDDDDLAFVGAVDATGLFTPNVEGPNPKRTGERNNIGDVWVVAAHDAAATSGKSPRTLRGRSHLLVTVPLYLRWEPWTTQ